MKKNELIKKVCTTLKINETEFNSALALKDDEDVNISIAEDLIVLTQAEQEARDKEKENNGIKTGKELGYKEIKKAAGLAEDAPSKDPAKLSEAIAAKAVADAKIPSNEKVQELTTQNQLLTKKLEEKETEIETVKKQANQFTTDRKILTALPKNRATVLEDDEILEIIRSKHIKEVDGELVVAGRDGEILRDKATTKPLGLAEGLQTIFTERKWIDEGGGAAGGRGGKDEPGKPSVFTKKSQVIEYYAAQGKSINGEFGAEIVAKIAECAKDASFDMNS